MLVLAGLLALARFALAAASWDTGNGFALMGASRDLMISVFVEISLILAVTVPALIAGTTDLRGDESPRPRGCASLVDAGDSRSRAVAFAVVVVAETGRQPVDNPDTHLELTMIHEGPLLEYAGRDLAFLQWAGAARHWLVLVLGAQVFLPHPAGAWWELATLPLVLLGLCVALALVETLVAKMRMLRRAASDRASRALIALLGIVTWLVGSS